MKEYLFSVEITWLPSYLPNRGEHHKSWVLPVYLQSTLFKDLYLHLDKSVWYPSKHPIYMKWFCCNTKFALQVKANDAAVIPFGPACTYHLNSCRAMLSCHKCCFDFIPRPCSYTPFSDAPAPLQPPAVPVPPLRGVWIFYRCNSHTHLHLVQTKYLATFSYLHQKLRLPGDLARALHPRHILFLGMPLATQNLQISLCLSHLQRDLRVQKGQWERGLCLTCLTWCRLRRDAVLIEFLCNRQFHN